MQSSQSAWGETKEMRLMNQRPWRDWGVVEGVGCAEAEAEALQEEGIRVGVAVGVALDSLMGEVRALGV